MGDEVGMGGGGNKILYYFYWNISLLPAHWIIKQFFFAAEVFQGTLTLQKNWLSTRQKKLYGTSNEYKEILDFSQGIGAYGSFILQYFFLNVVGTVTLFWLV